MIRLMDSLLLASTKLKVRKVRLTITLIISSLLFAALFFLAFITTGIVNSLVDFGKEGYGNRYLVEVSTRSYSPYDFQFDPEIMKTLDQKQAEAIAAKKAAAKKLGITYGDPEATSDGSLPLTAPFPGAPAEIAKAANPNSPIVRQLLEAKNQTIKGATFDEFTATAKAAGASKTYRGKGPERSGSFGGPGVTSAQPTVEVLIDGKEDFDTKTISPQNFNGPTGIATITQIGWSQKDSELLKPFILPNQTIDLGADASIPVIAPASAVEEMLGMKALPQTASDKEKLARRVQLRKDIAGQTAQICYRNGPSADLLQKALQQKKETEANKKNKDYVITQPVYQLPTVACGATTITKDTRTADEKKLEANQKAFNQQFDPQPEPTQGVLTVRIVGINADVQYGSALNATAILNGLLRSSLGDGWFSPTEAISSNPLAKTVLGSVDTPNSINNLFYAEFPDSARMTSFIKASQCSADQTTQGITGIVAPDAYAKANESCIKSGKLYFVQPYGNSAAAIEQFQKGVAKVARYVILVVVVIAVIILMGTIGKIIADSRRETAVFRALGAKRFDIAQIYLTYSLLVGCLTIVISFVFGVIGANLFDTRFSPATSTYAVLSYGTADIDKKFSFFGINPFYLWVIAIIILVSALVSALIPIITNIRRNPIRDMRDDS